MFTKDGKIDLNKCAERVTDEESGKEQVTIAQVKEVMGCFAYDLQKFSDELQLDALKRLAE